MNQPQTQPIEGAGPALVLRPKTLLPRLEPEYLIERLPTTIGRHRANDIELPFESVSRYHARIEQQEGQIKVMDLRSSNGTFVNGRRVQIAPLEDQDVLMFGSIEFTVGYQHDSTAPPDSIDDSELLSSHTRVHLVPDEHNVVESVIEADVPEDTSRISSLDEDITDDDHFRRAKTRLVTFYRLQEILRSTTDERKLLNRVLDLLFQVLPVDRGAVLTRNPNDTHNVYPLATRVRSGQADSIGISKTILTKCLKDKVAVLTSDAAADQRFMAAESIMIHRVRSALCVPLVSYHHFFGFIYLDTLNSIRAFNREDLMFVASVGGEVAVHLLNLRMLQEKIRNERMAAIGQTITGMAHNIKNVLLLSQGGMELMAGRLQQKSYDSLDETWGLVKRGIDRINQMVKDMLDYSRARVVEKSRCQVNDLISEIHSTFINELEKRAVSCTLDLDPNCPQVMIDVDGLDKALMNLLTNAVEACYEGVGEIILRTRYQNDKTLVIEVEDNAGGIPAEVLPRIFTPFFTTKGAKGTGLGLAMTKKFVEDTGGRIEVNSRENEGTTFRIKIFVEQSDVRLDEGHDENVEVPE